MTRSSRTAAWIALAMLLSACGPTVDLSIRVRQEPANVMYGAPAAEPPAPLGPRPQPPRTGPNTPGFIAPPVLIGGQPDAPGSPGAPDAPRNDAGGRPQQPVVPGVPGVPDPVAACPDASPGAVPSEAAPTTVRGAPVEGTYTYRRSGEVKDAPTQQALALAAPVKLPTELTRTVSSVQTVKTGDGGDQTTYDVVTEEPGLRSTTSWLVVSPVSGQEAPTTAPGIYIRRIETVVTAADGTVSSDVFQPQPPVKVVDLPFVPKKFDALRGGRSVDPLTGATMEVYYATEGQVTVDLCGTLHRAWRVRLGQEEPSTVGENATYCGYSHPQKHSWVFVGTVDILPQFGGIIAQDSFHFLNGVDDGGGKFDLRTEAVLTSQTPRKPA